MIGFAVQYNEVMTLIVDFLHIVSYECLELNRSLYLFECCHVGKLTKINDTITEKSRQAPEYHKTLPTCYPKQNQAWVHSTIQPGMVTDKSCGPVMVSTCGLRESWGNL